MKVWLLKDGPNDVTLHVCLSKDDAIKQMFRLEQENIEEFYLKHIESFAYASKVNLYDIIKNIYNLLEKKDFNTAYKLYDTYIANFWQMLRYAIQEIDIEESVEFNIDSNRLNKLMTFK